MKRAGHFESGGRRGHRGNSRSEAWRSIPSPTIWDYRRFECFDVSPRLGSVSSVLRNPGSGLESFDPLTDGVIAKAMAVHTALGPGLLESTYEACLAFELEQNGFFVERQKILPIVYHGMRFDEGYRIDLLVEGTVLLELKAVEQVRDVHLAQLLSYLRLSHCPVGLLLNFNVAHLREGIRRVINTPRQ